MALDPLLALSPLDGRYAARVEPLRAVFSEAGLMRRRVQVEVEWLLALAGEPAIAEVAPLGPDAQTRFRTLAGSFSLQDALRVKAIEATTNHDVKAIEYFLKQRLEGDPDLRGALEFVHFGLTSEDVNNLAYALMLREGRDRVLLPALDGIVAGLRAMAHEHAALPLLARTHGQPASPTTLGKEIANVVARLARQRELFAGIELPGKCNGAVGNYNALAIAYPDVDWPALSRRLVESLGLRWNPHTTQIEPHDGIAELCDALRRVNVVLVDLCRDLWGYIALGYFRQGLAPGEVGSSTMPHKVNPIDFENAEGNLGVATALLGHFSEKLPISRWQRDLTDSTVLRTLGTAFGHTLIALDAFSRGLAKLTVDTDRIAADLDGAWEVLAEAVQTVMRRHGLQEPYEQLKAFSRGQAIGRDALHAFIAALPLPEAERQRLLALTPAGYTGLAAALAREV